MLFCVFVLRKRRGIKFVSYGESEKNRSKEKYDQSILPGIFFNESSKNKNTILFRNVCMENSLWDIWLQFIFDNCIICVWIFNSDSRVC